MYLERANRVARLALIIGPESTATRLFTSILSQHPQMLGTPDAKKHDDLLDEVWAKLKGGDIQGALTCLPDLQGYEYLLTRRTIPYGGQSGVDATPLDIPPLQALQRLCKRTRLDLILLVTTRSTAANLASWTLARASSGGLLKRAQWMYRGAYWYIFDFVLHYRGRLLFFFLSLEALLLDQEQYVQSVFELLGLAPFHIELDLNTDVNEKRYEWYSEQGDERGFW